MKPGPQPIDRELLRGWAEQWACLLYSLRDGCPGFIGLRMLAGPTDKPVGHVPGGAVLPDGSIQLGAAVFTVPEEITFRYYAKGHLASEKRDMRLPTSIVFGPKQRNDMELWLGMFNKSQEAGRFIHCWPVAPAPKIWKQVKSARNHREITSIFHEMQQWALEIRSPIGPMVSTAQYKSFFLGCPQTAADARSRVQECLRTGAIPAWPYLPFVFLHDSSEKILEAKRLWTYPRTNRQKSDDKRIEFFAKAFAALTLGKSPATATSRWLTRWHWPRDWYNGNVR